MSRHFTYLRIREISVGMVLTRFDVIRLLYFSWAKDTAIWNNIVKENMKLREAHGVDKGKGKGQLDKQADEDKTKHQCGIRGWKIDHGLPKQRHWRCWHEGNERQLTEYHLLWPLDRFQVRHREWCPSRTCSPSLESPLHPGRHVKAQTGKQTDDTFRTVQESQNCLTRLSHKGLEANTVEHALYR